MEANKIQIDKTNIDQINEEEELKSSRTLMSGKSSPASSVHKPLSVSDRRGSDFMTMKKVQSGNHQNTINYIES